MAKKYKSKGFTIKDTIMQLIYQELNYNYNESLLNFAKSYKLKYINSN